MNNIINEATARVEAAAAHLVNTEAEKVRAVREAAAARINYNIRLRDMRRARLEKNYRRDQKQLWTLQANEARQVKIICF